MCHGAIDPRLEMRDAEDRVRASAADLSRASVPEGHVPPELIGGLRGAFARVAALVSRRPRLDALE